MWTGLPIRIDTTPLMSNKRMNRVWNVIIELTQQNWGTWIVCHCDEESSIINTYLAWIVAHSQNSWQHFKFLVQSHQETCLVLCNHVIVTVVFDNIWRVDLSENRGGRFFLSVEKIEWRCIFSIRIWTYNKISILILHGLLFLTQNLFKFVLNQISTHYQCSLCPFFSDRFYSSSSLLDRGD